MTWRNCAQKSCRSGGCPCGPPFNARCPLPFVVQPPPAIRYGRNAAGALVQLPVRAPMRPLLATGMTTPSIKKKAKKGGTKKGAAAQEDKAKAEQARKAAASGLAVRAATAPLGASPSFLPRLPPPAFHHDMSAAAPPPGHHRIASARLVARVCAPHASMPCWRRRASARSPPAANPPSNYCGRCRNGTQRTQAREDGVCQQAAGARSGGGGGVETTRGGRR